MPPTSTAAPHPSPAQKKALQTILEKRPVRLQLGILSALKSRGWIQLAPNDQPMGTATSYDLTTLGRTALGLQGSPQSSRSAGSIGLESETCEECGGSGQWMMLDEQGQSDACPWCHGSGRIQDQLQLS